MATPPRAAIYTRISRDAEQEGLGVTRQEQDCRALAAREGFTVTEVYTDNDTSASTKSRARRPAYERLLEAARAGDVDVILAYSNSRLTRRPAEWLTLIELANTGKLRIKTVASGEHDLSTADGRAVALTVAAWDAAEAERTAERVTRAHRQRAESGHHNGPRPYGFQKVDGQLIIDPAEAEVVREVVRRVLAGEGIWRIVQDLNARGVTTTTGGPWATQTLRRMALRWTNAGHRSHQPRDDEGRPTGRETLHRGTWEPIIDRATHERVIATLTDPRRRTNNRGTAERHLLTGIARCGACDRAMVGATAHTYTIKGHRRADGSRGPERTRTYPAAYRCPHAGCQGTQRGMAEVDAVTEAYVLGLLESNGVQVLGGDPAVMSEAEARIAELTAKLDVLADQFAEDHITAEQLARATARIRPQIEAESARLRAAHPAPALAQFADQGARSAWASAPVSTRKALLRHLEHLIGLRITVLPVGAGRAREFDPRSVHIELNTEQLGTR